MTKQAKFSWNDENTAIIVDKYKTQHAENPEIANSTEFLNKLAKEVGATSGVSVRTKLVNSGEYQKGKVRKVGGGSSVRKAHYVRALEAVAADHDLSIEKGDFDSLESCKMDTLKLLAKLIPGVDEAVAEQLA